MPRQIRIEFEGAMYHVMARGDRRGAIVKDDEDRRTFVRTLGEASERAGFRVHAYVLMSNHYHLLLETPQANLARGMGWLQNAFTRRINTRHRLWGHVFGGRYKSILVEPGDCFWALLDYIHLNPARAKMVSSEQGLGLLDYRWSSLAQGYALPPKKRSKWLVVEKGLGIFDLAGTTASGWLSDRVDNRVLLCWYYALRGLSLIGLPFVLGDASWGLTLFAVFYGLDWIATVPPTIRLTADTLGRDRAGIMFGWIVAAHQIGASAATLAAGAWRTWSGSYERAFLTSGALCLVAAAIVLQIGRGKRVTEEVIEEVPATSPETTWALEPQT